MGRLVVLALSLLGMAFGALAQVPPPKQEKDLVAAGHTRYTAARIRQELIGNTSYIVQLASVPGAPAGIQYTIYYKNDRERVIRPAPGAGSAFTTLWWLEGDLSCGEERAPGAPTKHACYALYDVGSLRYACRQPDGLCASAARTVPGNPEKL
ncbi:MAG: hypothetical protein LCH95_15455 [Proteobacteria bacterium]|nr:hypothetical protein [Pseudomonadota bacterium]